MKQTPDAIYIITRTSARAEEIRRAIILRGFDEISCLLYPQAMAQLQADLPVLTIVDLEGDVEKTNEMMERMPAGVASLVLVDAFDEALFLNYHDQGARDVMVKPVAEAYLVSRVIRALNEKRLEQVVARKDQVLVEMGVLSAKSGLLSTSYLMKLLKQYAEVATLGHMDALSMVVLQLEGYPSPLPEVMQKALMGKVGAIIRECARGLDEVGEYFVDKFAVILPKTGRRGAKALANRLVERLHGLEFVGPSGLTSLEVRVGLAEYSGCRHYEDLLDRVREDLNRSQYKQGSSLSGDSGESPLRPV